MDSQCPGCLGQAVVTLRLPSAIVESLWRHKRVPFVNIASVRSRSIKRRQWRHKMDYYGVVFAHLATGRGINAKDPSGLDSDRWISHSRCCENPARAKALAGFSRHLSAGFTDLNPAPRGLSLYMTTLLGLGSTPTNAYNILIIRPQNIHSPTMKRIRYMMVSRVIFAAFKLNAHCYMWQTFELSSNSRMQNHDRSHIITCISIYMYQWRVNKPRE